MLLHNLLKFFLIKLSSYLQNYIYKSLLFPTIIDKALSPLLSLKSSIHWGILAKVSGSKIKYEHLLETSNTKMAQTASFR